MSKPITFQTTLGQFPVHPSQFVGCKEVVITDASGQSMPGVELFVSIGAVPGTVADALRMMAHHLDEANAPPRIVVARDGQMPPLKLIPR